MHVKILWLFGDLLNLYGECGNLIMIKRNLEEHGFTVTVTTKKVGEELNLLSYDFIYIGNGTNQQITYVLQKCISYRKEFEQAIENNKVILATGKSYEMFGRKKGREEALAIFDFICERSTQRMCGPVQFCFLGEGQTNSSPLVEGFLEKETNIYHNFSPLFRVETGSGENAKNDFEGTKEHHFWGTHLIGPFLHRNPFLVQMMVKEIEETITLTRYE